jgi:type II secretory ATPase GspE/PulE/Tfp pilus assembly ATPase PilB-like protein
MGFTEEDLATGFTVYQAVGCDQCRDGYKGRVGIYEVMKITPKLSKTDYGRWQLHSDCRSVALRRLS